MDHPPSSSDLLTAAMTLAGVPDAARLATELARFTPTGEAGPTRQQVEAWIGGGSIPDRWKPRLVQALPGLDLAQLVAALSRRPDGRSRWAGTGPGRFMGGAS